jgi:hypothetical protein
MNWSVDVKCVLTRVDDNLERLSCHFLTVVGCKQIKCLNGMCYCSKSHFSVSCIFIFPVVRFLSPVYDIKNIGGY